MMKMRIYTDGACSGNPGPGGWGAVILFPKGKQEMSGFESQTTNNRMELKAVIEALKLTISLNHKSISVYSDSAYVVNAINNGWIKNWYNNGWKTVSKDDVKNKDLWIEMIELISNENINIEMIKVKGHSDNIYNNRCDEIARKEIKDNKNNVSCNKIWPLMNWED